MRIRAATTTLLASVACVALAAGTARGAPAPRLAPPGQAVGEGVTLYLAPPGPNIGEYGLNIAYQTAAGQFGEGGVEGQAGQALLLDTPVSPASPAGVRYLLVTTGRAAYASVDGGPQIPLQPAVGPPYELRAALYEVPGVTEREVRGRERRLRIEVKLTDATGAPLAEPTNATVRPNPALETRIWEAPARPARGLCSIGAGRFPGLRALSGSVISVLRPVTGVVGRRWLTCATTAFSYRGGPTLEAWVLLDGTRPGRRPDDIASMTPVAERPGFLQARPGEAVAVARRIRHGWLLVRGGTGLAQCLSLVAHLHAAVVR